jgi:hypothetical protein
VKSFRPAICVDREGNVLLDSSGEIEIARRYINTKALLDCESDEEALKLLGIYKYKKQKWGELLVYALLVYVLTCFLCFADKMAAMEERMLKLRHKGTRVTAKDRVGDLQRQAREDS